MLVPLLPAPDQHGWTVGNALPGNPYIGTFSKQGAQARGICAGAADYQLRIACNSTAPRTLPVESSRRHNPGWGMSMIEA